ncbi:hypothetical protein IC229_29055 [Spirosoma sp. BT702]|uniref:Uncharacterized protein n=1 Tax=Spirosoma profusum TaxID=2771354 RepID=A0A927AUM3_9BACT|nr:hypothetical protein [Spirosoma profusum]MBD2704719.1 hypothetical protein [Spirosoma profusum]
MTPDLDPNWFIADRPIVVYQHQQTQEDWEDGLASQVMELVMKEYVGCMSWELPDITLEGKSYQIKDWTNIYYGIEPDTFTQVENTESSGDKTISLFKEPPPLSGKSIARQRLGGAFYYWSCCWTCLSCFLFLGATKVLGSGILNLLSLRLESA